ncbi:MAG: toll/interleukin-1 receptor domain-containing protein [Candidatus Thorarchaeota archaeon]
MPSRRRYSTREDDSKHRFKIRSDLPLVLFPIIIALALLSSSGGLSFNTGWIWIVFGILFWIAGLIFYVREVISDLVLILSGIITTWGTITADFIAAGEGGSIPNWTFLFVYLMLFILMKYERQMAVHIGVSFAGLASSFGWYILEIIPSLIGIVTGLLIIAIGLFFRVTDDWNFQVCIGFLIVVSLIFGGWWTLSLAINLPLALVTYLLATLGSIISGWGIINIPIEYKPPKKTIQKSVGEPTIYEQFAPMEENDSSINSEPPEIGPKVFLSHQHGDKEFVRKLAVDLKKSGIQTWVDEAEILVGDSLLQKISSAIAKEVDFVAAILSPKSVDSGWVQKELELAMNKEIPDKDVFVLPIIIETCTPPDYLTGKLYLDFRDDRYNSEIEMFIDHIKKHYSRKSI